jgi:predicted nucleic acid-binding Zn ribbon protein
MRRTVCLSMILFGRRLMARVMRELVVCDVCGSDQDVAAVSMVVDGGEQTAELCAAHRQNLQEAVAGVLGGSTATTRRRGRPARKSAEPSARKGAQGKRAAKTLAAGASAGRAASRMPRTTCPHCGMEMGVQNLSRHIAAKHPEAS